MLAVFCFNLLGDGLRDIVDPSGGRHMAKAGMNEALLRSAGRPSTCDLTVEFAHPARHRPGGQACRHQRRQRRDRGVVGESGSGKSVTSYAVHAHPRPRRQRIAEGSRACSAGSTSRAAPRTTARPARPRDVDDLPEPAHRAQPDPQGRPADRGRAAAACAGRQRRDVSRARPSRCWSRCASPAARARITPIRSSCPAACASAS